MERYKYTGEEPLTRRRLINEAAKGLALFTAGYYSCSILTELSEQQKELSELWKTGPRIDNAYININKYKACQNITDNRCKDIIPQSTLSEIQEAQVIVEQNEANKEEIRKHIKQSEEKAKKKVLVASFSEFGIGVVLFISRKLAKLK